MVYLPPTILKTNVEPKKETPRNYPILNLTNIITHLFIGSVSMHLLTYANAIGFRDVRQHIYLCVFGFIIIMPQAFLSINITGWAGSFSDDIKKIVHYMLQVIGSILGLAGGFVMMAEQVIYSYHGIIGIFLMLFTSVNLIIGGAKLYSSKTCLSENFVQVTHSVLEYLIIIFAFVAMTNGLPWDSHPYFNILGYTNHMIFMIFSYITLLLILALLFLTSRKMLTYMNKEQKINKTEARIETN